MRLPLYQTLHDHPPQPDRASAHMGLWFQRYFSAYTPDFDKCPPEDRSRWLSTFKITKFGNATTLQDKATKLAQLAQAQGGQARLYHCEGNFVTGTGNAHPLENGFTWHPTLGMPYLPGSAVKGLVRALVETAYEGADKAEVLRRWFGTEEKGDVAEASGCFIFFDALPVAPCELLPEVMTPHMGKWYEKGGKDPCAADTQPGDWHSPVPVGYLVARGLQLQFAIAPRAGAIAADRLETELANVWRALDHALEWLGAGAKTAIGFGRMQSEAGRQRALQEAAEQWPGARAKFNRANGALTVEKSGRSITALHPHSEELLASLPPAIAQKVRANQAHGLKFTAYVAGGELLRLESAG